MVVGDGCQTPVSVVVPKVIRRLRIVPRSVKGSVVLSFVSAFDRSVFLLRNLRN